MDKRLVYLGSLPHPAAADMLARQQEVKVVHLRADQRSIGRSQAARCHRRTLFSWLIILLRRRSWA